MDKTVIGSIEKIDKAREALEALFVKRDELEKKIEAQKELINDLAKEVAGLLGDYLPAETTAKKRTVKAKSDRAPRGSITAAVDALIKAEAVITPSSVVEQLKKNGIEVASTSVNVGLAKMVKDGKLVRKDRGVYAAK